MADLKTILKYQDIDLKLRRLTDSIEKSETAKRGALARNEFEAAKKSMEETERNASDVVETVNAVTGATKDAQAKVAAAAERVKDKELTSKERKQLISELEAIKAKLSENEKKVEPTKKKGEKIVDEYTKQQTHAKKMRDIYNASKEKVDKDRQDKEKDLSELKRQLDELRPNIDKELMKVYDGLAAERKFPPVVEAHIGDRDSLSCRGCGLQLSQAGRSELTDKGVCRCDNCRRVIYMPQGAKAKK